MRLTSSFMWNLEPIIASWGGRRSAWPGDAA
jgi:hypothetical protein